MSGYKPRLPLMKHQLACLEAIKQKPPAPCPDDAFAILAETGTGKSAIVLAEFGEGTTSGGPLDLLVLAGAGSISNWHTGKTDLQRSELETHLDPAVYERLLWASWNSGGGGNATQRTRLRRLMECDDPKRPRAMFVNVEALSTDTGALELCREFLQQRLAYMVQDELTKIKGHNSRRAKNVVNLGGEAAIRRGLTGLVTPKSPLDLFMQFNFLDWRILRQRNFFAFKRRYAVLRRMNFGGRAFDQIVGYQNVEELEGLIAPYSYSVLKKDCLDLEPKVYKIREVEQTPEQRRLYKELKQNATTMLSSGAHVSAQLVITQMIRMHTINLGFVRDEEGQLHEIPERRTAGLLEELEECEGKAIVWAPFDFSIRRIIKRLTEEYGPRSVAAFWGGNKGTRGEDERRFLGDPECRFMVSSPAAGGFGNTWNVASDVVYYGNDYNLEHRFQSEDRNHRKGQTNRVTYTDLVARDTVDEKILRALREKIDLATLIMGEGYRKWLI